MAFRIKWHSQDRLTYQRREYTILSWEKGKVKLQRLDNSDIVDTWDEDTLEAVWDASNDFKYEPKALAGHAGKRPKQAFSSLSTQAPEIQDHILYRLAYVEPWIKLIGEGKYKITARDAEEAAKNLQPIVDRMGVFKLDDVHRIINDDNHPFRHRKGKGRVRTPMPEEDGSPQVEELWYPSGYTLLDWFWKYRDSGCDPLSLKPEYFKCGYSGSHIAPEVAACVTKHMAFYLTLKRPSMKDYLSKVVDDVKELNKQRVADDEPLFKLPGMGVIEGAIAALNPYYLLSKRWGDDYARKEYAWADQGIEINVAGQRVEIDAYQVDVSILATWSGIWEGLNRKQRRALEKKRMWLTIAIDRATRCIVGMRLSDTASVPDAVSVMEMVESDKTIYSKMAKTSSPWHHRCGVMGAVADGGYVSAVFRAALADARATLEFTKAGDPTMRGVVERIFRTVAVQVMERLNGKTFNNIFQLGDYDSDDNAGLTVDELAWILVTWVVDIYHNTPHEGLRGLTPNERWDEVDEDYGIHPWRDAHGRRSSFGVRLKRMIRERGFNVLGNWYRDDDPDGARGLYFNADRSDDAEREFEIAFDPSNLGAISVITDGMAISVPCRDPKMEGRCAEDWIAATTALREENEIRTEYPREVAHQALQRILEVNENAHARSSIARKVYSTEQIEAVQNGLFKRIDFADAATGQPSDILGEDIDAYDLGTLSGFLEPDADEAATDAPAADATGNSDDSSDWIMSDDD